jgi:hypothetical protein
MSSFTPEKSYAACMDQIMHRVKLLVQILDNRITLGEEVFNYEVVALNFRKILECMAYASLSGHHKIYTKAHFKAERHHRAKDILNEVEKLNPQFYPAPKTITPGSGTKDEPHHLTDRDADYLSRDEFITLFDKCSEVIHVQNVLKGPQHVDFINPPKVWLKKITNLLDHHCITISGSDQIWFVIMMGEDGKAHVYDLGKLQT